MKFKVKVCWECTVEADDEDEAWELGMEEFAEVVDLYLKYYDDSLFDIKVEKRSEGA